METGDRLEGLVDERRVGGRLVDGDALTGDRGLVDARRSGQDDPIGGDPLVGSDHEDVSRLDLVDRHLLHLVAHTTTSSGRRQIRQRGDLSSGSAHRVALERVPQREQHQQQRRVRPVAQGGRTHGGHQHQQLDVEPPSSQRAQHVTADHHARDRGRRHVQGGRHTVARGGPIQHPSDDVDAAGRQRDHQLAPATVVISGVVMGVLAEGSTTMRYAVAARRDLDLRRGLERSHHLSEGFPQAEPGTVDRVTKPGFVDLLPIELDAGGSAHRDGGVDHPWDPSQHAAAVSARLVCEMPSTCQRTWP